MTKLVLKALPFADYGDPVYAALLWQDLNKDVLSLCPSRWTSLDSYQKWCLLRILALRPGYEPDWVAADIWRSLRSQLMWVDFEDETTLLCLGKSETEMTPAPDDEFFAAVQRLEALRDQEEGLDCDPQYLEECPEYNALLEEGYPMAYEDYPEYPAELDFHERYIPNLREDLV